MMYEFCNNNAFYSGNFSFTMFIFILNPFNIWHLLFQIKSESGVAYEGVALKKNVTLL